MFEVQKIGILVEVVFILLHFFAWYFSYLLFNKKFSHPAVLFSFLWLFVLTAHLIFKLTVLDQMGTLSVSTYLVLLGGVITFIIGSLVGGLMHSKLYKFRVIPEVQLRESHLITRVALCALLVLALPFYIKAAFEIFVASKAEEFFMGLKHELSYGDTNFGIYIYLLPIGYITFAMCLFAYYKFSSRANLVVLIVSLILVIAYGVFAAGRLPLFMVMCVYLGVGFFLEKKISSRKLVMPALVFLAFFLGAGFVYKKGGDVDDSFKENLQSSTESLGVYMVSSLNALDVSRADLSSPKTEGERTFRFFKKIASQVGLIDNYTPKSLLQEFVFVPYATNVYTFYRPYTSDYSESYAFLILFIYGGLHTVLYRIALKTRKQKVILYYSFLLFPLFLSFFDDQYLSIFSFWLQMVLMLESILIADSWIQKLMIRG